MSFPLPIHEPDEPNDLPLLGADRLPEYRYPSSTRPSQVIVAIVAEVSDSDRVRRFWLQRRDGSKIDFMRKLADPRELPHIVASLAETVYEMDCAGIEPRCKMMLNKEMINKQTMT